MATDIDTYCGIYCGACSILRYGKTGHGDEYIACCGNIPRAELNCSGCKSENVYAGCRLCMFRDCNKSKGIEHCIECIDYPCKKYKKWLSAARLLPHVSESSANLETIKREGLDAWIKAQEERWSCPHCGTMFSWYASECSNCGYSLKTRSYSMSGFRKILCRLLIPLIYKKAKNKNPQGKH